MDSHARTEEIALGWLGAYYAKSLRSPNPPKWGYPERMPKWALVALVVIALVILVPGVLFEAARFLVLFGALILTVALIMWLVDRPSNRP